MQEVWDSNPHSSTRSWTYFEHCTGEGECPGASGGACRPVGSIADLRQRHHAVPVVAQLNFHDGQEVACSAASVGRRTWAGEGASSMPLWLVRIMSALVPVALE